MDIRARLAELKLTLPASPKAVAAYVPAVRAGNLIYVSGQLPMAAGELTARGPVPSAVALEAAQAATRQCALNALAIVVESLGDDWDGFERVVRLGVFVCSDDSFTEQHKVANGASEFLVQVLGDAGRHARAAVGVNALPMGASVELEMLAQVRG